MPLQTLELSPSQADPLDTPLLVNLHSACRITAHSRSSVYAAIKDGRLIAVKAGKRTLFRMTDLQAFVASLPRAGGVA